MPEHKFKIGERLFLVRSTALNMPGEAYVVIKRLPKHDGEFEYQIKSVNEPDERVVRESQLRTNPLPSYPSKSLHLEKRAKVVDQCVKDKMSGAK